MRRQLPSLYVEGPIPAIGTVMSHAPFQVERGVTCQVQLSASVEIDEGNARSRLERQIAQCHEHRITEVVGNDKLISLHVYKSRIPTTMACIMISVRVFAGHEKRVGLSDQVRKVIRQIRSRSELCESLGDAA